MIRSRSLLVTVALLAGLAHEQRADALTRRSATMLWPGGVVPVCFDETLTAVPGFDRFYTVLRTNVENTWGRVANLRFTGWGTCPGFWPAGTVVLYSEYYGFNAEVGYNPWGPTTFKVDFTTTLDSNNTPQRWAYFAVHEFGHVLGFDHEMDRADNPWRANNAIGCQPDGGGPPSGELDYTPYDVMSIMTYDTRGPRPDCGIATNNRATKHAQGLAPPLDWFQPLSAWDVVGVQALYGRKPAGTLVGLGGRCVNIAGDRHEWGTSLMSYDCYGVENDRWTRAQDGTDLTLAARLYNFAPYVVQAIDVPNAYLYPSWTNLWDYPVNNSVAQQFVFNGQQWKAYGEMCMVADTAASGSWVRAQTCTGTSANERWDFQADGRLRLSGTPFCAEVPSGIASIGNPIQLQYCGYFSPFTNEVFRMTDRGEITFGGLCMNVWGGNTAPGSPLALYSCAPTSATVAPGNEVFYSSGPIRGQGGQCLDTYAFPSGVSWNGQSIGLTPCNGNLSQVWDYHFLRR